MNIQGLVNKSWFELERDASNMHKEFVYAKPFPHIVIDELFDQEVIIRSSNHFPQIEHKCWRDRTIDSPSKMSGKLQLQSARYIETLHPAVQQLLSTLISAKFTNFLEVVSTISGLVSDPFFIGGGLQMTLPNGELKPHTDFLLNKHSNLLRRVNVIIYLNSCDGGELQLYSSDKQEPEVCISPKENRLVIFETREDTVHGHSKVMPDSEVRKSVSAFYYVNTHTQKNTTYSSKAKFIP